MEYAYKGNEGGRRKAKKMRKNGKNLINDSSRIR
jgi:hypothetical protein